MKHKQVFMRNLLILFALYISTIVTAKAQYLMSGAPFNNGSYTLGGTVPGGIGSLDSGTNFYVFSPASGIANWTKRVSNIWTHGTNYTFGGGGGTSIGMKLILPTTSSETNPPCGGVWEKYHTTTQLPTGEFFYVTLVGTCSTVGNPPPPSQAVVMTPYAFQLPSYLEQDIVNIPNPAPGMMVWDITNTCVKVYNGTTWNCL